jgi:hypothetical protein
MYDTVAYSYRPLPSGSVVYTVMVCKLWMRGEDHEQKLILPTSHTGSTASPVITYVKTARMRS